MLGTASTQQLFASANSIGVIPQVWGEWNYNSFIQPMITTSGSGTNLVLTSASALTSSAKWTSASATIAGNTTGRNTDVNSSGSSISIIMTNDGVNQNFIATATSASSKLTNSASPGYYKLVFYAKVNNFGSTSGTPNFIQQFPAQTNNAGTASYYYRVVGIGNNGQTLGPDITNNSDVAFIASASNTINILEWTQDPAAVSYKIYRSNNLGEIIYLDSVGRNLGAQSTGTYQDNLSTSIAKGSYLDNDSFNTNVNLVPVIKTYDESMTQQNVFQTCKVYETTDGNSTFSRSTIDVNFERWQKIEICFGVNSDDTNNFFSRFLLDLNFSANHKNAEVLITDFNLYKITEFDFKYQDVFPTESAFLPTRPGEVLLHPLLPNEDKFVKNYSTSSAKPITFVTKIASGTPASKFPTYDQISDSDNKFKYYVSSDTETKSLQAIYDKYLSINKIIIKLDESYSLFSSGSVNIYASATNTKTAISLSGADFNSNGIAVLYYSSAGWSTTSWDSPPQLTASGTLQYVNSQVRSIEFVCNTTSSGPKNSNANGENRIRVIELSPRLEIDLSNYTYQVSCKKDLVSTQSNGLPFSWITANSGTIEFSNIPSYYSRSTTFENDSKSSVFYNLMRQGVKFTATLKPSSYEKELKEKIPLFVMYSDAWSINDLDSVSVELYDISKLFMMGSDSMHYFAYDTNVITVIKELLDYSGFSDYDYNGLYQLPEINAKVSGFWTDEQKTVFTNLQEFLLPHQIAASIDEYGMLRFESLSQVFNKFGANNFSADFAITDYPVSNIGSSSSRYIANLIPDSLSETISQKIGAIVVNYKTPLTFRSNVDKSNNASSLIKPDVNTVDAPHSIWTMKEADGLSQFFINDTLTATDRTLNLSLGTISVAGDETTSIDTEGSFVGSRRTPAKMSGDLLIGSEIVGYSGMEYTFSNLSNTTNKITRTIYDYSDLQSTISDFQIYNTGSSFASTSSIQFVPTGKLMNLVRGKYGTPIDESYNHSKYSSLSSTPFRFFSASGNNTVLYASGKFNSTYSIGKDYLKTDGVLKISGSQQDKYTVAQALNQQGDYNFYSLSFSVDDGNGVMTAQSYINNKTKNVITPAQWAKLTKTSRKQFTPNLVLSPNDSSIGFIFNTSKTVGANAGNTFCVEIQQDVGTDKNKTVTNKLVVYKLSDPTNLIIDKKINCNFFDGQPHTFNLYFGASVIVTAIDGVFVTRSPDSGKTIPDLSSTAYFCTYVKPLETADQTLLIYELYAAEYDGSNLTSKNNRHFTSQQYLNDLIDKTHRTYNYFHYSSPPLARGINFYDVKLESAPVFTTGDKQVNIQKVSYKNPGSDWTMLQPVNAEDISYSSLKGTAFQQRFALAHDGPSGQGLIILNTGGVKSGDISQSLTLLGNNMYLSEQKTLKRVIDKNYENNTISLTVDWARDTTAVEKIISNIVRANSSFNLDYNIKIFGNPLIQAGDFGQITYKLKGLGVDKPLIGLITSVRNTYRDGLDNTELTFKPIIIS